MTNNIIPAYDWKSIHGDIQEPKRSEYIKSSTMAIEPKEVRKYLKEYLKNNNCTNEIKNFLKVYLNNIALLSKTQVVWDGSYRNCVIVIKPDHIMPTHTGDYFKINSEYTITKLLTYFLNNSETIFLNMHTTTHAEDMENWRLEDMLMWDSMDDYNDEMY